MSNEKERNETNKEESTPVSARRDFLPFNSNLPQGEGCVAKRLLKVIRELKKEYIEVSTKKELERAVRAEYETIEVIGELAEEIKREFNKKHGTPPGKSIATSSFNPLATKSFVSEWFVIGALVTIFAGATIFAVIQDKYDFEFDYEAPVKMKLKLKRSA